MSCRNLAGTYCTTDGAVPCVWQPRFTLVLANSLVQAQLLAGVQKAKQKLKVALSGHDLDL